MKYVTTFLLMLLCASCRASDLSDQAQRAEAILTSIRSVKCEDKCLCPDGACPTCEVKIVPTVYKAQEKPVRKDGEWLSGYVLLVLRDDNHSLTMGQIIDRLQNRYYRMDYCTNEIDQAFDILVGKGLAKREGTLYLAIQSGTVSRTLAISPVQSVPSVVHSTPQLAQPSYVSQPFYVQPATVYSQPMYAQYPSGGYMMPNFGAGGCANGRCR